MTVIGQRVKPRDRRHSADYLNDMATGKMQTINAENASNDATMRFLTSTHILKQNNLLSFVISLKCPAMTTFNSDNSELQHKMFSVYIVQVRSHKLLVPYLDCHFRAVKHLLHFSFIYFNYVRPIIGSIIHTIQVR